MKRVTVTVLECFRCTHEWQQRGRRLPKICPKCKNPNWNVKRPLLRNDGLPAAIAG